MPRKDLVERAAYQKDYCAEKPAYARVKAWRAANKDKVAEQAKRYAAAHPEVCAAKAIRYRKKNTETVRANDRIAASAYRATNKAAVAEAKALYAKRNPGKINAAVAKRKAIKLKQTPHWLTNDAFWMIEQAYELAATRTKLFGFAWHVDHIVPLQGKMVSGLHTPHNLCVIPGVENIRKGNRYG
jgi:hypothetical protein